jgi:predicted permease
VLLIVCVNVGNLMMVRTANRDREVGIRMALGSSRGQLFLLVLNEALVLVAIGSGLGLLLAHASLKGFTAWAPVDLPRIGDIHMGSRVLLFMIVSAVISTSICGLLPAWRLASTDPHQSLKSATTNATAHGGKLRFRELMVSVEIALSTVLLVIGGLLMFSFFRVMGVARGFEVEHVITQDLSLANPKYNDANRSRLIDEVLRELAVIPGVRSVGVTNQIPLRGESWTCDLRDMDAPGKEVSAVANFRFVNPTYWETLGIPLKVGRFIESADRNRPVAVLSERAARALWPGQDPIGKRVGSCGGEPAQRGLEVIGIVENVRAGLEKEAPLTVYQPYWTSNMSRPFFALRTEAAPAAIISAVRGVFRSIDSDLPISQPVTMQQVLDDAVAGRRFQMTLAISFAASALFLAALGIYGVISFAVARRTPELGIRLALGARRPELASMVVRQGMMPVWIGLAAGLAGALFGSRLIASQLYGVTPNDPLTIAAVTVLLLAVAVCACWIPARRAMRIDPLTALRFE